jgi:hypothetical protein
MTRFKGDIFRGLKVRFFDETAYLGSQRTPRSTILPAGLGYSRDAFVRATNLKRKSYCTGAEAQPLLKSYGTTEVVP